MGWACQAWGWEWEEAQEWLEVSACKEWEEWEAVEWEGWGWEAWEGRAEATAPCEAAHAEAIASILWELAAK